MLGHRKCKISPPSSSWPCLFQSLMQKFWNFSRYFNFIFLIDVAVKREIYFGKASMLPDYFSAAFASVLHICASITASFHILNRLPLHHALFITPIIGHTTIYYHCHATEWQFMPMPSYGTTHHRSQAILGWRIHFYFAAQERSPASHRRLFSLSTEQSIHLSRLTSFSTVIAKISTDRRGSHEEEYRL